MIPHPGMATSARASEKGGFTQLRLQLVLNEDKMTSRRAGSGWHSTVPAFGGDAKRSGPPEAWTRTPTCSICLSPCLFLACVQKRLQQRCHRNRANRGRLDSFTPVCSFGGLSSYGYGAPTPGGAPAEMWARPSSFRRRGRGLVSAEADEKGVVAHNLCATIRFERPRREQWTWSVSHGMRTLYGYSPAGRPFSGEEPSAGNTLRFLVAGGSPEDPALRQ